MFTARLTELRKQKGLTQDELGKILGFRDSPISQYETGKRRPDQETLTKIPDYFDVTTDYLLGRSNIRNLTTIAAHRADNPLADLSPEARKSVEDYIEYVRNKYPKKDTTN